MAYRKKEDWLAEAERLGIDTTDMDWPTLQKTVSQALKREEYGMLDKETIVGQMYKEAMKPEVADIAKPIEQPSTSEAPAIEEPKPASPSKGLKGKRKKALSPEELELKKFAGQELKIAPEIYPNAQRAVHYKEDLGEELIIDEKHYDIRGLEFNTGTNIDSGTYIIRGKTGERVIATSAIPKEQPGLFFRPDMDYAVVVAFMNRAGYLWTHHRLPNVKALLKESGYYEEYKSMFKDEPNIWYSAGLLCCDPSVVHSVFKEIEEKERLKRERGY